MLFDVIHPGCMVTPTADVDGCNLWTTERASFQEFFEESIIDRMRTADKALVLSVGETHALIILRGQIGYVNLQYVNKTP